MRDLVYKQMKAATKSTSSTKKPKTSKTKAAKKTKPTSGGVKNADDVLGEAADDEETPVAPAGEPASDQKPAFGSESIEDLLGSIRQPGARDEL